MPVATKGAESRFVGPVMGRYTLDVGRFRLSGVDIFACRSQSISSSSLVVTAPVVGAIDDPVSFHFLPFGPVRGIISRHLEGGFAVDIDMPVEDRERLAGRIDWYKKRIFAGLPEERSHRRFMPREPRSALVLAGGDVLPCLVVNVSASGAAISADIDPPVGAPLAIGKALARVVRKLEVGFAVRFVEPQNVETVEDMLRAPDEWARAMQRQQELATSEADDAANALRMVVGAR